VDFDNHFYFVPQPPKKTKIENDKKKATRMP